MFLTADPLLSLDPLALVLVLVLVCCEPFTANVPAGDVDVNVDVETSCPFPFPFPFPLPLPLPWPSRPSFEYENEFLIDEDPLRPGSRSGSTMVERYTAICCGGVHISWGRAWVFVWVNLRLNEEEEEEEWGGDDDLVHVCGGREKERKKDKRAYVNRKKNGTNA